MKKSTSIGVYGQNPGISDYTRKTHERRTEQEQCYKRKKHSTAEKLEHQSFIEREVSQKNWNTNLSLRERERVPGKIGTLILPCEREGCRKYRTTNLSTERELSEKSEHQYYNKEGFHDLFAIHKKR